MKALIQKSFVKAQDKQAIKYVISVDLLMEKGLVKKAHKVVTKAKSLAYYFEDFTTVVKANEQEEKILLREGTLPSSRRISELMEERRQILDQAYNLVHVQLIAERVMAIQPKKGYLIESKLYDEILKKPVFWDKDMCKSIRALERLLYTRVFVFNLLTRRVEFLGTTIDYLDFLKKYNHLFEPSVELEAIAYHLKALTMNGRSQNFQKFLGDSNNFTNLLNVNATFSVEVKMYLLVRRMEHANIIGNSTYAKQVLTDSQTLEEYEQLLPVDMWEFYSLHKIACYIQLNQFEPGLRYYDRWYSKTSDIHLSRFIRVFNLILILELGLTKIMDSELEATRKFLKKNPFPNTLQTALLSFFRRAFMSSDHHSKHFKMLELHLTLFE